MSEVQGFGGFEGFGGGCNLTFCIAVLLVIHCCLGRSFGFGGC